MDSTIIEGQLQCRICTNVYTREADVSFIDLFQPGDELQREIEFVLSELQAWDIQIDFNDGLPQFMCVHCFAKFCSIDEFRRECQNAQRLLQTVRVSSVETENSQSEGDSSNIPNNICSSITNIDNPPSEELQIEKYHSDKKQIHSDEQSSRSNRIYHQNQLQPVALISEQRVYENNIENVNLEKDNNLSSHAKCNGIQDIEDMLQGNVIPKKHNDETLTNEAEQSELERSIGGTADFIDDDELDGNTDVSNNPYACQYCYCPQNMPVDHLIFHDYEALSQHLFAVHDPKQPFTCPYCSLTYKSSKLRDNHVLMQHNASGEAMKCHYCCKVLRVSRESHENICSYVGDWVCEKCNAKFEQIQLCHFRAHQRLHVPMKVFKCSICDRRFTRRANLEAHEKLHNSNEQSQFQCTICNKGFQSDYELRRHKYQLHQGDLPAQCPYCSKGFVSNAFLRRHIQNLHPEEMEALTCKDCGATFSSIHKLRFHMQRPRDENGKCIDGSTSLRENARKPRKFNFPCSYCSKRYYTRTQLDRHLTTHNPEERPYQCQYCHIRNRSQFELDQHINLTHKFDCTLCSQNFIHEKDLHSHMISHNGELVKCSEAECEFTCDNDKLLNEHIRKSHPLFACEYCNATYTQSRLIKHLNEQHPNEIDVEVVETRAAEQHLYDLNNTRKCDRVLVEYVSAVPTSSITVEEQAGTTYSTISTQNEQLETFFLSNLIDPENEIIVT